MELIFDQHFVSAGDRLLFKIDALKLEKSKVHMLLGENGVGKTTFFKGLCNLEPSISDKDNILKGFDWKPAYVGTQRPMVDYLTVFNYLGFGFPKFSIAQIQELLSFFALVHLLDQQISSLSDGEFKKVAIVRQLVGNPTALFLDEPSAYLDIFNKRRLGEFLQENKEKYLMLVSTHDLHFAKSFGDHFYQILDGELRSINIDQVQ